MRQCSPIRLANHCGPPLCPVLCVLADDTPPINLPAYATAGIAKCRPIRTGVQGFKYDSAALLLPFMFAINPTILLITDATVLEMAWAVLTAAIGMATFASSSKIICSPATIS
ncbi:hypothetical protein ACFPFV_12935 [Salinicoccus siamensis]|uniref:hypothetical protein n=1 Tax=Salinicoccus siamensis TaxID=381830 RepID=UPI003611B90B